MANLQLIHAVAKLLGFFVRDRFGAPLAVVLGEQLDTIAASSGSRLDGPVVTTGDAHVGTENWHQISFNLNVRTE